MANTDLTLGQKLKKQRRKRVKRFGKRVIRGLSDFLGRQSLVGDMPIHDTKDFPFLKPFVDNWEGIRAEDQKSAKLNAIFRSKTRMALEEGFSA